MSPPAESALEKMLASYAYSPSGNVGGNDGGKSRERRTTTRGHIMMERESRRPVPPRTPPLSRKRGKRRSVLIVSDGGPAARDGTRAEVAMAEDRAVAFSVRAAAEVFPPCVSSPSHVLLAGESARRKSESSPSCQRGKEAVGPCTSSRFHKSTSPGLKHEEGSHERVAVRKRKKEESLEEDRCGSRKTKKKTRRASSRRSEEDKDKGLKEKRPRRKKIVVVSPYFASSADKLIPKGEAGAESLVEVVVQRRRRKRAPKSAEENADAHAPVDGKRKMRGESAQLSAAERLQEAYKRVPDDHRWVPPFSDFELLQESHFFDHWRVLVICMLLNRTTGRQVRSPSCSSRSCNLLLLSTAPPPCHDEIQVRRILPRLFLLCSDAETTTRVSEQEIEEIIRPLGLQNKRSKMIKRMSEEYLSRDWTYVTQLHGIGKYAADAYAIFCSGRWKDVKPDDHKLVDYWRFLMDDKDARQSITAPGQTR